MLPRTVFLRLLALLFSLALLAISPAKAQGLGLDIDLGGIDIDLNVGGGSGLGLDVGVGDTGLELNLGGAGRGDVDALDAALGAPMTLSQEAALQAVRSRRAMPLDEVMLRAQLIADGEIIDAELIAVRNVLLYAFKVLNRAGRVSELYFYARSGMPVE